MSPKVYAIYDGDYYAGQGVTHLSLPDGVDIAEENKKWRDWYDNVYCKSMTVTNYLSFAEWLERLGAGTPSKEQFEIYQQT